MLQQTARVIGPVVEVGRRAQGRDTLDLGIARRGTQGQRAARTEARDPHVAHPFDVTEKPRRGAQVIEPSAEREVAGGVTAAPEGEDQHEPTELGGDSVGELRERLGRQPATAAQWREPVADDQTGELRARPALRSRQMTGQLDAVTREDAVHAIRTRAVVRRCPSAPSPRPRRSVRGSGRRRSISGR